MPQQLRSQRLVARILDATARILIDAGPGALNTNAVAEAAGISVGSLYRYFPNKDALVVAVVEREGRRFQERILSRMGDTADLSLADRLARIVSTAMNAYRSLGADDVLGAIELRRAGLFDRRVGALTAIREELTRPAPADGGAKACVSANDAPVVAEIIVALIEAAAARPSPALAPHTVQDTTVAAALAYASRASSHEDREKELCR